MECRDSGLGDWEGNIYWIFHTEKLCGAAIKKKGYLHRVMTLPEFVQSTKTRSGSMKIRRDSYLEQLKIRKEAS